MKVFVSITSLVALAGCATANAPQVATSFPLAKGTLAAINKQENTVSLIDLRTGKTVKKLSTGPHPQEVVFSPDGKTGVISDMGMGQQNPGKTLTVIDLESLSVKKQIELGEHGAPHGVVYLDDHRVLMTSHATDSLVIVNVTDGKIEKAISSGGKGTHLAVLSPDKKRAYAANVFTQDVSVIDLEAGKLIKTIRCDNRCEGIAISPDGKTVTAGNVGAHNVSVIDTQKLEVVHTIKDTRGPIRTFFTNDGKHILVSCAEAGELAVFDAKDYSEVKRIKLSEAKMTLKGGPHPMPMNYERHPDGKFVYVVIINADAVAIFDTEKLEVVGTVATGSLPDGIGYSKYQIG